tara:strand:+ start:141 stop:443 length:303 start_codon:yes stop_codon:yes gene_type:complete
MAQKEYKVALDIDIDVEELLDACGIDYTRSEFDDTQNVVSFELDHDEFKDVLEDVLERWTIDGRLPDEQDIGTALLNPELGECCTRVEVLTPQGDTIIFK